MNAFWALTILLIGILTSCQRAPVPASAPAATNQPVVNQSITTNQAPPLVTPPTPVPAPPVDNRIPEALKLKADGKPIEARALLQELATNDQAAAALGELNAQIALTALPAPEKLDYTIQPGDTLGKIANRYGTTIELLRKANHLTGDKIRVGDRLRIYQGKFTVIVSKNANTLTVTDAGKFFKRYRVGTGQFSKTPVGDYKITVRQEKPDWHRGDKIIPFGDPENILGTHWLGLDVRGYGIHGTWETNSIGKQSSAGCIRMLNDDVAELFTLLPVGTPVSIHD